MVIIGIMQDYWKNGVCPISNQLTKRLRAEFNRIDYSDITDKAFLAKVLRLVHAKPKDSYQEKLFKFICS